MSSENHDNSSSELLELLGRDVLEICKQPKFSYTRDFLLSLSELDICKKLPAGFDVSLLSEFEDSSSNSLHQNRNLGGFYSQSSRRNEYGYVQTNRSDTSSNYSRGCQGKWETRSSGSSDREELQTRDLQTRDSSGQDLADTGKHNPNQPHRLWKQMEQDGLLGKPSGYSGQASAQRSRGNGLYTLDKSTEPYQPPRPYKAISHSWRDNRDSINDETFGSSDCSEDKAEEEKSRRASFELMRKEQHKALQEKQKQIPDNHKVDSDAFSIASSKDHVGLPVLRKKKEDDVNIVQLQSDSSRTVQTPPSASRPLVPPGFRSTTVMKNVSALPSEMSFASEAGQSGPHILPILSKDTPVSSEVDNILEAANITSSIHTAGSVTMSLSNATEKVQASPISRYSDPLTYQAFGPAQATEGWMDTHVHSNFTNSQDRRSLVNMPSSQDHPKSNLDELFQNASKQNGGLSNFVQEVLTEERWSTSPFMSKFSDWFPDEKKQSEEKSPPKDLFSQFFNNEKAKSQESLVINGNTAENSDVISSDIIPDEKDESVSLFFLFESNKTASKAFDANSNIVQNTKDYYAAGKLDASLSVLTCEDLEQSILAEANATDATKSLPPQWHALHVNSDPPTNANDHASQQLRLLLHVGSETQNLTSNFNEQTSEIFNTYDGFGKNPSCANDNFDTSQTVEHSSKGHNVKSPLVFEGLFPADVMEGLQSTEGPLSKQTGSTDGDFRTSIASQTHEPPSHLIHGIDDPHSSLNQTFDYVAGNEVGELNNNPVVPTHQTQESWTGFKASGLGGLTANGAFDINYGFKELRLPEEERLIGPGQSPSLQFSDPFSGRNSSRRDEPLRLKSPENILERSANFNPLYGNQRGYQLPDTEVSHSIHGSFDPADSDPQHRQLHGRHAPFLHQISQTGLPFQQHHPREFRNAHREFTVPDSVSYEPHHQFPLNIVHPQSFHNVGLQVNQSAHSQILPNMPVPGNFPLQDLHGFPRGVLPSHSMNGVAHIPDRNLMHGVPMPNRQTGQSDIGMEIPGMAVGGTLGRIFAMDARAARQTHPLAGSHLHGSHTPEVDLGFRYR